MQFKYMDMAIDEAKNSGGDIPVGCVIVKGDEVIAKASNTREKENDPMGHAEINAIKTAAKVLQSWRLLGCDLYVTLEPCPMCAWAILNACIQNVYFGAYDLNYGAFGSRINLSEISNTKIKACGGIRELESKKLLDDFFKTLREK